MDLIQNYYPHIQTWGQGIYKNALLSEQLPNRDTVLKCLALVVLCKLGLVLISLARGTKPTPKPEATVKKQQSCGQEDLVAQAQSTFLQVKEDLDKQIESLRTENQLLKTQKNPLEPEVTHLRDKVEALQEENRTQAKSHAEAIKGLAQQRDNYSEQVRTLQKTNAVLQRHIQTPVQKELEYLQRELRSETAQCAHAEEEIRGLQEVQQLLVEDYPKKREALKSNFEERVQGLVLQYNPSSYMLKKIEVRKEALQHLVEGTIGLQEETDTLKHKVDALRKKSDQHQKRARQSQFGLCPEEAARFKQRAFQLKKEADALQWKVVDDDDADLENLNAVIFSSQCKELQEEIVHQKIKYQGLYKEIKTLKKAQHALVEKQTQNLEELKKLYDESFDKIQEDYEDTSAEKPIDEMRAEMMQEAIAKYLTEKQKAVQDQTLLQQDRKVLTELCKMQECKKTYDDETLLDDARFEKEMAKLIADVVHLQAQALYYQSRKPQSQIEVGS